jgi:two-component system nitrogen regulation response regulator NtrX
MEMSTHSTPHAAEPSDRPRRILVIDDNRHVRRLLGDLMSAWGYEADMAADGAEGLALFGRRSYDAVLTDFAMPNVNGLEVAAGVRDVDPSVAVILFTASTGVIDLGERRPGLTVLSKPLDIEDLRRALHASLAGSPAA